MHGWAFTLLDIALNLLGNGFFQSSIRAREAFATNDGMNMSSNRGMTVRDESIEHE